jgi:hypothetical protein
VIYSAQNNVSHHCALLIHIVVEERARQYSGRESLLALGE